MENLKIPNIRKLAELIDMPVDEVIEKLDESLGEDEEFIALLNILKLFKTLGIEDEESLLKLLEEEDIND